MFGPDSDGVGGGYGESSGTGMFLTSVDEDEVTHKHTGLRVVAGLTCALSLFGSLLILLSYACFKQLRSRPREILMHISVMDLGVSLANLIGDVVFFGQYYHVSAPAVTDINSTLQYLTTQSDTNLASSQTSRAEFTANPSYIDGFCRAQAFFAAYFTMGSIFWTVFLGLYIYLFLLYNKSNPKLPIKTLVASYFFNYSVPLLLSLWLVFTHRLGYTPYNASRWCTLIVNDPSTGEVDMFVLLFANDLWIYLATLLILLFYVTSHIYIHWLMDVSSKKLFRSLLYKFLCIPVVFILLRIWTNVLSIIYVYAGLKKKQVPFLLNETLYYLSNIGDSGQGFANAILFVFLSKKVRKNLWQCLCCRKQLLIDIREGTSAVAIAEKEALQKCVTGNFTENTHLLCQSLEKDGLLVESMPADNDMSINSFVA